jgi:hypothetical protein
MDSTFVSGNKELLPQTAFVLRKDNFMRNSVKLFIWIVVFSITVVFFCLMQSYFFNLTELFKEAKSKENIIYGFWTGLTIAYIFIDIFGMFMLWDLMKIKDE